MNRQEWVEIDGVAFEYATDRRDSRQLVLDELDLTIRKGEFMCMLGPSGCGKTTVLNLLAGFERHTRGSMTIDGRPLNGPGVERSVVFQGDASLFHWLTARENVEFGLRVGGMPKHQRAARAAEFLELVGLRDHADKYPRELSGGMKQRVNLARALAGPAEVLLMDEPFGQLDAQTRTMLQDELVQIWRKTHRTIFFVTHDIAEAVALADRIVVMRRGPRSNVQEVIECPIPRPRDRSSPEFGLLYGRVSAAISMQSEEGWQARRYA